MRCSRSQGSRATRGHPHNYTVIQLSQAQPAEPGCLGSNPNDTIYQSDDLTELLHHLFLRSKDVGTQDNICLEGS